MHTRLGRCLAFSVFCHLLLLWPQALPKLVSPPALRVSFAPPLPLKLGERSLRATQAAPGAMNPMRAGLQRRAHAAPPEGEAGGRESVRTALPQAATLPAEHLRSYRLAIARLFAGFDAPMPQQALQVTLVLHWPQTGAPRVSVAQSSGDTAFDDWAQRSLGLAVQRQGARPGGGDAGFELDFVIEAGVSASDEGAGG